MKPSCFNCKFWENHEPAPVGECRRHAPVLIWNHVEDLVDSVWPVVDESDWCGEFQEKGSKLAAAQPVLVPVTDGLQTGFRQNMP